MAKGIGGSHVWRRLIEIKDEIEHLIWWQIKAGSCNFWHDNWTRQGALYFIEDGGHEESDLEVEDFMTEEGWNLEKLREHVS